MEGKLRDLLVGAGIGDIIIPRKDFIKEHKNLLGVLKSGKRSALDAEYKDQAKELQEQGGSRNSGFIARMMGEVKQVHKGKYAPITSLAKNSTMNSPRVFSYDKVKTPSGWLQTKFGKAKASVSDVAEQNKARRDRQYTEERYIQPYKRTIENIKYYSKPENWKFLTTKERASLYQKIHDLDYYQKQVPEVGANPYPNADSLPYVEMRRAYKMWLKKNNLSDKKG